MESRVKKVRTRAMWVSIWKESLWVPEEFLVHLSCILCCHRHWDNAVLVVPMRILTRGPLKRRLEMRRMEAAQATKGRRRRLSPVAKLKRWQIFVDW